MAAIKATNQIITKKTITEESVQELQARLQIEVLKIEFELREKQEAAQHQRLREKAKMIALMVGAAIISAICLYVSFSSSFQPEEKRQAAAILLMIVSYFAGKGNFNKNNSS